MPPLEENSPENKIAGNMYPMRKLHLFPMPALRISLTEGGGGPKFSMNFMQLTNYNDTTEQKLPLFTPIRLIVPPSHFPLFEMLDATLANRNFSQSMNKSSFIKHHNGKQKLCS